MSLARLILATDRLLELHLVRLGSGMSCLTKGLNSGKRQTSSAGARIKPCVISLRGGGTVRRIRGLPWASEDIAAGSDFAPRSLSIQETKTSH
jgi:hypothetical protein